MTITIILCSVIVLAFLTFRYLIWRWENSLDDLILKHKRIIEYFPSVVSTLGVLGTFLGITIGLVGFDSADLNASIPKLLEGLKTAFFTSLLGMLGSIFLSSKVNRLFDKNGASDAETAAARICNAVESMSNVNNESIRTLSDNVKEQAEAQKVYHRTVGNNFDIIKQNDTALAKVIGELSKELKGFAGKVDKLNESLGTMIDLQRSQETAINNMKTSVTSMADLQKNQEAAVLNMKDSVDKMEESQHHHDSILSSIGGNTERIKDNIGLIEERSESQNAALAAIAAQIVALAEISNDLSKIQDTNAQMSENSTTIRDVQTKLMDYVGTVLDLQRSQETAVANIKGNTDSIVQSLGNVEEQNDTQKAALVSIAAQTVAISKIGDDVSEILDVNGAISGTQNEIATEVKTFGERLHAEVIEIEDGMEKTNKLLAEKFDEFSELLKKSNTEALVEVMKRVTEEFEKQMNALISKLIQENFDQLNKSVERLNTWQQENKEMIVSLTSQYKEMANSFETTSTSLSRVKEDTQMLVSDGGKLRQLVDSLNKVIIEDEKFIKLTTDLQTTANLSKDNMVKFDNATTKLNDWVRKQRNFVDAVQVLLAKLEEIGKIKDYNEQFWQGTKKQMEEGVGIIKRSTDTLNTQLTEIDRRFYARLSTTLAELDACITSLVKNSK